MTCKWLVALSLVVAALGGGFAGTALAQPPTVTVQKAECFPVADNGVINANVRPEVGGATARLYFRWTETAQSASDRPHGDMYYVDMVPAGGGSYWGIPAKPEPRNDRVEYYVAVVDPTGKVLGQSERQASPVRDDCEVKLSPKQIGYANNLVVGETVAAQEGHRVLGFLCDGVVTRINADGIMRPDEICRGCVIPWWTKEEYVGSALLVPTSSIVINQPPISRSRP